MILRKLSVLILSLAVVFFGLLAQLALIQTAYADGTVDWTGQGITNGELNTVICGDEGEQPGSYLLWVFTLGGGQNTVTGATLNLDGSGSGSFVMTEQGNEMKAVTPFFNLATLDAEVSYTGNLGNGSSNLVISHGCPILPLEISKTADTTFTRTWDWTIDKTADEEELEFLIGDPNKSVNYEVTVDAEETDTYNVAGTITITNPEGNPDATVESVVDELDESGIIPIVCDDDNNKETPFSGFPYDLPGGETITCTYNEDVEEPNDGTENTVTVTTSGDVEGGFETVDVIWSEEPDEEIDECIDVSDDNVGVLGTVCANVDDLPKTFIYSLDFGTDPEADIVLECGSIEHINVASFVTNDTEATGDDSWTVIATVDCGCTLTQGYWKTHSSYGPAPYDETWAEIGEDTEFFSIDKSYYEVLWTAPKGNAYYQLAHQYIAALLNVEAGASVPTEVQDALEDAEDLFGGSNNYTPALIKAMKGNDPVRQEFIELAGILGSYNEGLIGPGHCEETTDEVIALSSTFLVQTETTSSTSEPNPLSDFLSLSSLSSSSSTPPPSLPGNKGKNK